MNSRPQTLIQTLERHTRALALPRGRRVGRPGHEMALDYLRECLGRTDLVPFLGDSFDLGYVRNHPNTRKPQRFTNLAGVRPGRDRTLPPILLGAHYDSVIDAPCADDNATSVALNLAIAETSLLPPLERDLIIAFFDAEEPPFFLGPAMGSRRFCEDHCRDIRFAAVIVSDLIGHDATDCDLPIPGFLKTLMPRWRKLLAVIGAETNGTFSAIVEAASREAARLNVLAVPHAYVGAVSDHAAFSKAGQPFLFLSCGQGRHYHMPADDPAWINFPKLADTTCFVADLIGRIDRTPADAERAPCDSFDTEIRMLRRAIGPALPLAMRWFGISMPRNRGELDALVRALIVGRLPKTRR